MMRRVLCCDRSGAAVRRAVQLYAVLCALLCLPVAAMAQSKPADEDVLVLSNGDTLHGKLVSDLDGKVTFHSAPLGDLTLSWDNIKELHTSQRFAVLSKGAKLISKKNVGQVPAGTLAVEKQAITVQPAAGAPAVTIPVKNTSYVLDEATLDRLVNHEPKLYSGWSGQATAGAAVVTATQKQYTFSGGIGLVRVVPTVSWLRPRNRTSMDFTGSFGKITQAGYFSTTLGAYVPEVVTKSAIYHADAERDEYFSPRFFALVQTAFDHNYSQDLDLQQIYGGGFGWTVLKTPRQEADLKGTVQYEKQLFITSTTNGTEQDLVGSTYSANYMLHLKLLSFTQGLSYIPAYNNMHAYSVTETNLVAFPAYKSLSFSMGTMDSYLNDPPASEPPTKRNSLQFTMGLTYAIRPHP